MTYSYRSLTGKVGALLLVTCTAASVVGCSKKKQEDEKAQAEKAEAEKLKLKQSDRYADGQRLTAALKDWVKRWADTADLPACDPLLKDAADLELCKTAQTALATMKAAAAKPEPEAALIHAAAELAYATEAASEKLRTASMEKMQAEHAGPMGSGSAKAPPPKPPAPAGSAPTRVKPVGSAAKLLADKMKAVETSAMDPSMQVMQAYSRVNRAALRYLSQFLQFGPLATRKAAFTELEALAKRKETWPALGRTLREAAMAENDPDLQGQLKALAPKLSRRGPGGVMPITPGTMPPGSMAPGSVPPGHPPMPQPEPPPAPAKDE